MITWEVVRAASEGFALAGLVDKGVAHTLQVASIAHGD